VVGNRDGKMVEGAKATRGNMIRRIGTRAPKSQVSWSRWCLAATA
jgi:hypothetical protein